ncbi:MAG: Eco57I restriction-modification methylase domain-containing protein [Desulfamplus sp.]|nr:Eco57I restriction-modification methylase domain-containing protein [Desulfamplus sp.]
MNLTNFTTTNFLSALKSLFQELQVPVNYLTDEPASAKTILKDTYKDNETFNLIDDIYFLGMVDDAAFSSSQDMELAQIKSNIKSDYDGVLIFGITLKQRENNRLPTRSQLAQIARAFNREFFYTPVVAVFKYDKYLAFANTERLKYKQEWREGEKAGKVTLLRDIDLKNPHAGHLRILNDLKLPKTGKNKVDSFATLYSYWQDVFSANILNKKFYQELSNWYFWAVKEVAFPSEPTEAGAHLKKIDLASLKQEHNAKNVIRLLTRFLFVWFIKEKKLIPEELFDMQYLTNDLLKDMSPVRDAGLFQEANKESIYYKAVLQNLFFASLNCPIEPYEKGDNRKRGFRLKDNYSQHRDANYLMRYQDHFKNSDKFLELMNSVVPFLNGGLFECLDNKTDKVYIDGFSDNLVNPHQLIVPDYLFFGFDQEVDLTEIVGINSKAYKNAKVKGLISILESYKFTVAENTPIEEDVALDPELLGKVFENLLASYNPETKTTARKQTGSFYTPREIVNYMVDESLIAYLKTSVKDWGRIEEQELDKKLHELFSYNEINPFAQDEAVQKQIIHALDNCKILDPACGSGAFPMGTLQKMVHILQKVDPDNRHWYELQKSKAVKETEGAFAISDKKERADKLSEINDAFDEKINDPDYARKLFLVENCIYGVDIQPIATQISKLRFFISLVVDQKVDREKPNFGIRALPNLETKFVAANTLIGIDKPDKQMDIFDNQEIKELEQELKNVRHRLFSAKSPATKRKLRDKDKEIREKIGNLLVEHGWANETAKQLAAWDPYNQNDFSPFFDPEWMFGIADGFDVVIGNPPYGGIYSLNEKVIFRKIYISANTIPKKQKGSLDTFTLFIEHGFNSLRKFGILNFIVPISITSSDSMTGLHYLLENNCDEIRLSSYSVRPQPIFINAVVNTSILFFIKTGTPCRKIFATKMYRKNKHFNLQYLLNNLEFINVFNY